VLGIVLSSLLCSSPLAAQQAPPQTPVPIQSRSELVKIEASVLDPHGDFVSGLTQGSFRVLDNGVERPIEFFAPVETAAHVLVLLETSPAVYLIRNQHLAAAYALIEGLDADDEVALAVYDRTPRAILSFTPDKSAFLAALDKAQFTIGMGDLNCYDSISAVLDWLAPVEDKKAIVLISTGLDSSPPTRWNALAEKLGAEDVPIFSVALGGPLRGEPAKKPRRKKTATSSGSADAGASSEARSAAEFAGADEALRSLATITGGRAYFPQSDNDFVSIYHEIAAALRHEYVLGVAPAHDNQFHALTVEVLGNNNRPNDTQAKRSEYRILARAGYLAPRP